MIRVCSNCSNVSVQLLEEIFGEDHVEYNCLGECGLNPEQSFGYVNEKWLIEDTEEGFIEAAKQIIEAS